MGSEMCIRDSFKLGQVHGHDVDAFMDQVVGRYGPEITELLGGYNGFDVIEALNDLNLIIGKHSPFSSRRLAAAFPGPACALRSHRNLVKFHAAYDFRLQITLGAVANADRYDDSRTSDRNAGHAQGRYHFTAFDLSPCQPYAV